MDKAKWLTPLQLAAWSLPELGSELHVELPALQRGVAWRPYQSEDLWDFIVRGFPVGSLMLSPYREVARAANGRTSSRAGWRTRLPAPGWPAAVE